jgi:peptide/nickel transport system substrate-binding protein
MTVTFGPKAVATFVAIAMMAAACGGDGDGEASGGTAGDGGDGGAGTECTEERVGGSITVGAFSEPIGLDPVAASGGGVQGGIEMAALYDTLMRYDPESGEYEPHLAESLEANDDLSEWTLTLPDGITFSNGDALDADVVKASVERHASEDNATPSRNDVVSNIAEITVVDPLTVQFTLNHTWAGFPFLLTSKVGMITNPTAVAAAGDGFSAQPPPEAGVGPYEMVRFAPGEEIVMRAKADYWDGPVCIEELRFVVVPGADATYDAFQTGELQAMFLYEPRTIAQAHEDGVAGHSGFMNLGGMMLVNIGAGDTEPPTADVRVRQAMAAAVDPEVINDRVYDGTGLATNAIVSDESRYEPGVDGPEIDPELAADLVDEVKADTDWDGSVRLLCRADPDSQETCITVKGMMDAVGFDVTLETAATVGDNIRRVIMEQDFDIANWSVSVHEEGPWRGLSQFYSDAPNNRNGYASPEMDEALDALRSAASLDEENAALADVQEVWNETIPSVNFATREEFIGWSDDVAGIQPTADAVVFFDDAYLTG